MLFIQKSSCGEKLQYMRTWE